MPDFRSAARAVRSLAEDFQMPGIAAVDALEALRARDDFCVQSSVRSEVFVEHPPKPISSHGGAAFSAPGGARTHFCFSNSKEAAPLGLPR
jgi:hypothetical protein